MDLPVVINKALNKTSGQREINIGGVDNATQKQALNHLIKQLTFKIETGSIQFNIY
jgi:hypothetical protein